MQTFNEINRFYGVAVSTQDSEYYDPGSVPGWTSLLLIGLYAGYSKREYAGHKDSPPRGGQRARRGAERGGGGGKRKYKIDMKSFYVVTLRYVQIHFP